jgi:hypothetical protein
MMGNNCHERLMRLSRDAVRQHERNQHQVEGLENHDPEPGDLYVLPAAKSLPVEWLVVAVDRVEPHLVLVVPTDTNPIFGPHDSEVPEEAPCGPLSLRYDFGFWIERDALEDGVRVGRVGDPWIADFVRERNDGVRETEPKHSAGAEDPDLTDWLESVPAKAVALVKTELQAAQPDATIAVSKPPAFRRFNPVGNPYGIAASVLLVITVSIGGGFVQQLRKVESMTEQLQAAQAQLVTAQEVVAQEEPVELEHELRAVEAHYDSLLVDLRDRIATLENRLTVKQSVGPLLNLPLVWLSPVEAVRGEATNIDLPTKDNSFLLVLEVHDSTVFESYRVEVRDIDRGIETWSSNGLIKSGPAELVLVLPSTLFQSGRFRISLLGVSKEGRRLVGEYSFVLN